jgi:uncharacterized membrane protein YqjE
MAEVSAESGGLLHSLRNLGDTLIALLQARLEIVSGEFEEQRLLLQQLLLLAVAAGFCLAVASLLAVAFIVVLLWDTYRIAAIGGLFIVFLATGIGLVAVLVAKANARPRLFATTMGELDKDREALGADHR